MKTLFVLTMLSTFPFGEPEVVVSFNPAAAEAPECVLQAPDGTLYLSMALTGEIRQVHPDGTQSTLTVLPVGTPPPPPELPGFLGPLVRRFDGTLFASLISTDPEAKGVWQVNTQTGEAFKLASLPPTAFPNGLVLRLGKLYVADSFMGVIWRVNTFTGAVDVWVEDTDLLPVPSPIPSPGANGLQLYGNELYTVNSSSGFVYAYKFNHNGSVGTRRTHATGVLGDDFAFDLLGNMYVTTDPHNTLLLVRQNGDVEVLLTAEDGLDGPTYATFGSYFQDPFTLYVTNAAFPFFTTTFTPSLMKVQGPLPGAPKLGF